MSELPVIDIAPLLQAEAADPGKRAVADAIGAACREHGFFYVSGHGVPPALIERLDAASRRFFALPEPVKDEISMARGGRAWRGFFPVGGELTSGRPDLKEGIYFGAEQPPGDLPLHGPNLFPAQVPELREAVLEYLPAMTRVGQAVMSGIALSLGLAEDYFRTGYTADPTILFRIFHYPPGPADDPDTWGVGEHTDYGLLTLLLQDGNGGLQVRTATGWIEAPPVPGTFVCNIGDMLDKLTGGRYRSTPHRVRNRSGNERLSFPFFFDPGWDSEVPPLPYAGGRRWDGQVDFTGTYGEYLLSKVSKVFPHLFEQQRL
ncbi:isopenicillin N synthase family oxygenase [Nonomuraea sp. FMUSA5-5]|uniref:Isopenicillin N synthase family oxygenase n=1 Tax=Nonomuraea composti TaxID=2720023 RepID=A0ABX1B4R2_9ACTN|nr:isopenicillin N synthase family oxygenase [Nonomuraea sp. FMUSA5-5]NJP89968.1 isopenicillin N synthase family oxygenase [Nonomuraea sp. FMUSA5-5]